MKYTKSEDGEMRVTVVLRLRFTREEIEEIKAKSDHEGDSWRSWLESYAALGIEEALLSHDGNYEQRVGKGCE